MPRLGYVLETPNEYSNFTYYGRGPIDNYADRKAGQCIEQFNSTVAGEFANFPKPQDVGNHEDVRWCALTNKAGNGAIFIATEELSVSALHYSALDLTLSSHIYKLPEPNNTYLHLDLGTTGLGGSSCGQGGPLQEDRIYAGNNSMGFIIRPVSSGDKLSTLGNVAPSGVLPISIARNTAGIAEITSLDLDAVICYSVDGGKEQVYTEPIELRDGGTIAAWIKGNSKIKTSGTYEKIESIPTSVIYTSSEEIGEGNATYLTDNDPNTFWHTMYSVTVAKHPHWVDLDAGEVKELKGFNFLPRQSGGNGMIKEYTIHVSLDGKEWGTPIHKATFANNSSLKKVIFKDTVKARYIRFTAESSHGNQDFATGAEITILEK